MMNEQSCRLCMSTGTDDHMNIFSDIGIELKMKEIISEHFKCEVHEQDQLPNFVCQVCWQTTESFHELYQKSKIAQETFLNAAIKIEPDSNELWQNSIETTFIEESDLDLMPIKTETSLGDSDSHIDDQMDYDDNTNDSDAGSNNEKADKSDDGKSDEENEPSAELLPAQKKSRKTIKHMQFNEFLAKHKNLLKMNCDLCPIIFETLREARIHYAKIHNNQNGYIKCCNSKLHYPYEVTVHIKKHLEPAKSRNPLPKIITCNVCSKSFTTAKNLKIHMNVHEKKLEIEDENYAKFIAENFDQKCDQCDTVFGGLYDAQHHYKTTHNEDRGYIKCCKAKLRTMWAIKDHIKYHLDSDFLKCDTCEKRFATKNRLDQHKRTHILTMNKSFICDYCKRACRDKGQLLRHMFSKHTIVEANCECEICHKKYQLPVLLKKHMYSAHREKKTVGTCEVCGKGFYTNFHLEKHKLQHIDKSERLVERKQCEHCGEWLLTKGGIFYHKQIHTSGPQKCPHCQLECANRPALLGHIRKHHREHKFKCSYCDKTFPNRSNKKSHEESHTRHKLYSCQFCDKTFSVYSSLSTHQKREHKEERARLREMEKLQRIPKEITNPE